MIAVCVNEEIVSFRINLMSEDKVEAFFRSETPPSDLSASQQQVSPSDLLA